MNGLRRRVVLILFTVTCVRHVAVAAVAGNGPSHQAGVDFFENRIRPLLAARCLKCHGAGQDPPEAGLRLDSRPGWLAGGDSGPAIVAGDPRASRLVRAVRYDDSDLQMPPDGKLDARQIADLVRWVKIGAPDPRTGAPTRPHTQQFDIEARRQSHWAWQPIAHALPPTTGDRYWPRSAVDAFVLKQLEQAKLTPANPAVRRVLMRRVTFDLVGLPPSPEEINTFLADDSPAAALKREVLDEFDQIDSEVEAVRRQRTVVRSEKVDERHYIPHERPWPPADVVEDFSSDDPDRWIVSGHRFGRQPARVATVLLGPTRERPIAHLLESRAAVSDLLSSRLTGLLRTRTFEIVGDTLWYRYRGEADVFLAVDSHRVVEGPLHRVVRQHLKGDGHSWSWHAHPVRDYLGHRVHVEFTPRSGFAIDGIEFSAALPPDAVPVNRVLRRMLSRLTTSTPGSGIDSLANTSSTMLAESIGACLRDTMTMDDIAIVNWVIDHPEIFERAPARGRAVGDAWTDYVQQKQALEKGIPEPVRAFARWRC